MNKLNFKTSIGISTIISLSLILASCGGGSVASYGTGSSPTSASGPITTTVSVSAASVTYNTAATIIWSSTKSDSCTSSPIGITGTSGEYTTQQLTASTPYTITCTGPTGAASKSIFIPVTGGSIDAAVAACANAPMRGNVYYYCDCGTGAETDCVPGADQNAQGGDNPGNSISAPRRTIGNAAARFSSLAVNDTVALCKGGAFNSAGRHSIGSSNRCGPGVPCNDLRDYTPTTFTGTAKPLINNAAGESQLFIFSGNNGGVRFLNLKLKGDGGSGGNQGFFFYRGAHDVTMCNLDMDAFSLAVYNESGDVNDVKTNNIKLTGSLITNAKAIGYLGGGDNNEVSYNRWEASGSSSTFDHAIYFASRKELLNVSLIGNYVQGQYGPTCNGAPIVGHMAVDGLLVEDNIVDIAVSATTGGCWGIAFTNFSNATTPIYHRNAKFSGNTIKNGGNLSLTVTGCPGCVIENNLIISETSMEMRGISVAAGPARSGGVVNTGNIIRNNTISYGPDSKAGGTGITVGVEGSGHVIHNNTVTYAATATGNSGPFKCYSYPLALTSLPAPYASIYSNSCTSAASSIWETTLSSLAAWQTRGFETSSAHTQTQ